MSNEEKEIDWKSIVRKVEIDPDSPYNLSKIDPASKSSIDEILKGIIKTDSDLEIRNQFIKDLERHSEKGKPLFTYRALKSALLSMKIQAEELCSKVKMTKEEFLSYVQETINKIDDIVVDMNTERYEEAERLLSDEEGFEELKRLQIEYHKIIEVLAIEGAVNDQKLLSNNTINLLSYIKKGEG